MSSRSRPPCARRGPCPGRAARGERRCGGRGPVIRSLCPDVRIATAGASRRVSWLTTTPIDDGSGESYGPINNVNQGRCGMTVETIDRPLVAGVVGLGMIGGGVAVSLARSGRTPVVHDVRPEASDGLDGVPACVGPAPRGA